MELLVSLAIFIIMLAVLLQMLTQTVSVWQRVGGESANRQNARFLLQLMGRDMQTAVFPIDPANENLQFQVNPTSLGGSGYLNPAAAFWQAAFSGTAATNGDIQDVGYFVTWVADGSGIMHGTFCRIQIPRPALSSASPSLTITPTFLQTNAPGLANTNLSSPTAYHGLLADGVVGLWVTLYATNMTVLSSSGPYNSQTTNMAPAYADIGIAMLNPEVAKHVTASNLSAITNLYATASCTNAASFVNALPEPFRSGAQSFTTRVQLKNVLQP